MQSPGRALTYSRKREYVCQCTKKGDALYCIHDLLTPLYVTLCSIPSMCHALASLLLITSKYPGKGAIFNG